MLKDQIPLLDIEVWFVVCFLLKIEAGFLLKIEAVKLCPINWSKERRRQLSDCLPFGKQFGV